jgi:hypothetical protein
MSVLLYVVGAIVTMIGVAMVGYGIPINEFSFGNTLIIAGTTATVGGLIVMAVGVAVGQLQRISEALSTRAPARSGRSLDLPETSTGVPVPTRIPFPPRPKPEAAVREPQPAPTETLAADHPAAAAAPTLHNPDVPVAAAEEFEVTEYEGVSLSPQQPAPQPAGLSEPAPPSPAVEKKPEPALDIPPWRSSPPPQPPERPAAKSYFDEMWPAETKPAKPPLTEQAKSEPPPPVAAPTPPTVEEPAVAILKSGVVDGMGYTLYVDGSIEAELPQGTLRFASINDLRSHLAKNS